MSLPVPESILPSDSGAQVHHFPIEQGMGEGPFHGQRDLFQIKGFHHEIVCAEADRFDRVMTGTERGDDNDRDSGKPLFIPNMAQDILASQFRHSPVGEYEIGCVLGKEVDGFRAVPGFQDFISFPAKNFCESFSEIGFVVDNKNGLAHERFRETCNFSRDFFADRKNNPHAGAVAFRAFDLNFSPVGADEFVANREAKPSPGRLRREEGVKNSADHGGTDPVSGVTEFDADFVGSGH